MMSCASLLLAVSFAAGQWDTNAFVQAKCARHDYIGRFEQRADCIVNACPAGLTPEEIFKKHNDRVYAALVATNVCTLGTTVASTMAFDWRMAPLIVLARPLGTSAEGHPEFREHWEIVLYDEGLNVWHHFYENGKQRWFKAAALKLPKDALFRPNVRYRLEVRVARDRKKNKVMTVRCAGYELEYVDESLPDSFLGGIIACEGRNFFYDFEIRN